MCEYGKRREAERTYCGRGAERPREPPRSCFLRRCSFIRGAGVRCDACIQDADDAYGRLVVAAVLEQEVYDLSCGHELNAVHGGLYKLSLAMSGRAAMSRLPLSDAVAYQLVRL